MRRMTGLRFWETFIGPRAPGRFRCWWRCTAADGCRACAAPFSTGGRIWPGAAMRCSPSAIGWGRGARKTSPEAVHDALSAVQFVRGSAAEFNLDGERVALMGASAGANIAALAALGGDALKKG